MGNKYIFFNYLQDMLPSISNRIAYLWQFLQLNTLLNVDFIILEMYIEMLTGEQH